MKRLTTLTIVFCLININVIVSGCTQKQSDTDVNEKKHIENIETSAPIPENSVECTDPRPQMCTREYMPVCATKDSGIRCITTPCPSTEETTYSTGCTACSDPAVISYRPGQCKPL